MSDTDVRLSNYRLHAPQYQAFDPTGLELAFAQQMTQPGASQLVGYLAGARMDREQGADNYRLALQETNRNAMLAGDAAERAADLRSRRQLVQRALEHPDAAAVFGLSRAEIDPRMGQVAIDYALNREAGQRARILEDVGTGMNQFSQAGLEMPQGATTDNYGFPRVPLRQGTSRAERVALVNGSEGAGDPSNPLSTPAGRAEASHRGAAERFAETAGHRAAMLLGRKYGVSGFDMQNGTFVTIGRAPLTAEQHAELMQAWRTAAEEARRNYLQRVLPGRGAAPAQPAQPNGAPPLAQGSYTLAPNGALPAGAVPAPAQQSTQTTAPIGDVAGYARTQMTARGLDIAQHTASLSPDRSTIIVRRRADNVEVARIPIQ